MVLHLNTVQENPNKTNNLGWSSKYERQLKNKVYCSIKKQSDHFLNFTAQLLKESYHSGFTNKASRTLAELFKCCRETVKRNLRKLEKLGAIHLFKMMSRYTKLDSSYLVVINWQFFDYYPPRTYSIQSLKQLKHVNLVKPSDRFLINGLFVIHKNGRNAIEDKIKRRSELRLKWEKNTSRVSAGSNGKKLPNNNNNKSHIYNFIKLDNQAITAKADDSLSNLIDNLSQEYLSIVTELGFNAKWYIADRYNRDNIKKAFAKVLWRIHRNIGTERLISACYYMFQYKFALFHEFCTAERLNKHFYSIERLKRLGVNLLAQNTFPCRLERYKKCFERK